MHLPKPWRYVAEPKEDGPYAHRGEYEHYALNYMTMCIDTCCEEDYAEVCWRLTCLSVMSDFLQPLDCSRPGSSVHRISQTKILE